jgi:hypothetical protein
MQTDLESWLAAEESAGKGDLRSANVMRMCALASVLAAAESAILVGDAIQAKRKLEKLKRYTAMTLARLTDGSDGACTAPAVVGQDEVIARPTRA